LKKTEAKTETVNLDWCVYVSRTGFGALMRPDSFVDSGTI